jgi:hypothetical protein
VPHLRCATCYQQIAAPYEEALTIALASHLEREHGQQVSLADLAPVVRSTMTGGGAGGAGMQLYVARVAAIVVGLFFALLALEFGPGWLAFAVLAGVLVAIINAVDTNQA